MGEVAEIININIDDLKRYKNNAKKHGKKQLEKLKESIKEFGFISPVLIDRDKNIIAGHGRTYQQICKKQLRRNNSGSKRRCLLQWQQSKQSKSGNHDRG